MPEYISFEDFVALLPTVQSATGTPRPAFAVVEEVGPFIAPEFSVEEAAGRPKITFVSARGATGKSTVAEQLSHRLNAPLWSLSIDKAVSGDAIAARISTYLGTVDPLNDAPGRLPLVIVDAMDEARLRVTGVSWDEFMTSLAEYVLAGIHLVVLGRQRTIEDVWYSLSSAVSEISWYEISHFNPEMQSEYVDLRALGPNPDSRLQTYDQAKIKVLGALNGATDASLDETFAGYAPVLDAVAKLLLPGQNYQAIAHDFEDPMAGGRRLEILLKILQSLLEREQKKVEPLAEQIGLDPGSAYSMGEQIGWLASELLGAPPPVLEWCPAEKQAEYRQQVEVFLHDHPFRDGDHWASPVFSSFVAADAWGTAQPDALDPVSSSSGLLFEFVASGANDNSVVEEYQFSALHASLLAGQWADSHFTVNIENEELSADDLAVEEVKASLELIQPNADPTSYEATVMLSTPGVLVLSSPLANLDVVFDGEVSIVGQGASIDLGPDAFVHARSVVLSGQSLQLSNDASTATRTLPLVEFEVTESFSSTASLIGAVRTGELSIAAPSSVTLTYPWVKYRTELEAESNPSSPDDRARRFLNKLMNLARKHGRSRRAVALKNLEGRQSLSREDFDRAVDVLVSHGVVERTTTLLFLEPSWDEHRFDGKGRPGMTSFEEKAAEWNPILAAISAALT